MIARTALPIVAALLLTGALLRGQPGVSYFLHYTDASGSTPVLGASAPPPLKSRPVLFVHGHNLGDEGNDPNYENNWIDPAGRGSFKETLDLPENSWLDLEPYYIRFVDQDRSIFLDAADLGDALRRILQRHDSAWDPSDPGSTTDVRMAVIAYSKGTISTRLLLKSIVNQGVSGLPAPLSFNPIETFVAISPPNHGTSFPGLSLSSNPSTALSQLNNGRSAHPFCVPLSSDPQILDFMDQLNGDPATPAQEAPGSRPNGSHPATGTLYVCLYADGERDSIGGSEPVTDCDNRKIARNHAPDAINIEVAPVAGSDGIAVHQNTVHTPEVICLALHTVAHDAAPVDLPIPAAGYYEGPRPGFGCTTVNVQGRSVPVIAPEVAVVLVLDLSGSMLRAACPSGCDPKLEVLQRAVALFLDTWAALAEGGHRAGLVLFGSQVETWTGLGPPLVPMTGTNATSLSGHVDGLTTLLTNLTAMGGGLQTAIALLGTPEAASIPERHVVLLTDGMQNVNPSVVRDPPAGTPYTLVLDDVAGRPASNATAAQPPLALDAALGIVVHTIAVGAIATFQDRLAEISAKTLGTTRYTEDPDDDLPPYFTGVLIDALQGNSPQLVDHRQGIFASNEPHFEDFVIDGGFRKLVLQLSWRGDVRPSFTVEKDGADLTSLGRVVDRPFHRLFVFDPRDPAGAAAIDPGGTWRMKLTGRKGVSYHAAAIVDHPDLELGVSTSTRVRAGEAIDLRARLTLDGRPLAGATVVATVAAPQESLANLLVRSDTPPSTPSTSIEGAGPAQRRYQLLLDQGLLSPRREPTIQRITLAPQGYGSYAASFGETQRSGTYRITLQVEGEAPDIGAFLRRETRTVLVGFGEPDRDASTFTLRPISESATEQRTALDITPRDKQGNHLGPGYAEAIAISLYPGRTESALEDHGDGRYTATLVFPSDSDPTLSVQVSGDPLVHAPLSEFDAADRDSGPTSWWLWVALAFFLAVVLLLILRRR